MIIYILNILLYMIFSCLSLRYKQNRVNKLGQNYKMPQTVFLVLSVMTIMATYVFRGRTGTDSGTYISSYNKMSQLSFQNILETRDILFNIICWIDYRLFLGSLELHYIVIGIITYVPIIYMYVKYTDNYSLAGILYILTTGYYFGFNGQRQAVAIGVCIIALILLMNGHWKWFIVVTIIASKFHSTALFMLPVGFLAKIKTNSKIFILVSICLLVSAILAGSLWNTLFDILGMMGQDKLVNDYAGNSDAFGGANILRFFVLAVPVGIGIYFYKNLSPKNKEFDFILNLNILGAICMLAGNTNWLFARLAVYTSSFIPILLMYISKKFEVKSKIIYYGIIFVLYFIYMWVYVHNDSNLLPYRMLNGITIN